MTRFIDASQLLASHARAPADDALWAELYFPRVEDLLRRLATAEKQKRYSLHGLLFGRWPVCPGKAVAVSVIDPMLHMWWLRPESNAARVGEQSAVV